VINTELLRNTIKEKGVKYKYIASRCGITPYGLQKKIDNIYDFRLNEIIAICDVLDLSNEQKNKIFFISK